MTTLTPEQVNPTEYELYLQLAEYLRLQYPQILYRFDLGGIRLTIGQARKIKAVQKSSGYPDLFIAEARQGYHGMFVEIKTGRREAFTKKGELRQDSHIQAQWQMLEELTRRGYFAVWGLGFEETRALIDMYLVGVSDG